MRHAAYFTIHPQIQHSTRESGAPIPLHPDNPFPLLPLKDSFTFCSHPDINCLALLLSSIQLFAYSRRSW